MAPRFARTALVVCVLAVLLDLAIYQYALAGPLTAERVVHPPLDGPWPKILLAAILGGLVMSWMYAQGVTRGSWVIQGLRFGLAVGILTHGAMGLLGANLLAHEGEALIVGGIGLGMVRDLVLGLTVAYLSRSGPEAAPPM